MKALVYHGPGSKAWEEVPDPTIQSPTDAIVQIDTTTICGTDLHILKGDVPAVTDGRILGHEGVGTIIEVGSAVKQPAGRRPRHHLLHLRLRVVLLLPPAAALALPGPRGHPGIGWIFGHLIDGTQAEFVRVPFADNSLHKLPEGVSDERR